MGLGSGKGSTSGAGGGFSPDGISGEVLRSAGWGGAQKRPVGAELRSVSVENNAADSIGARPRTARETEFSAVPASGPDVARPSVEAGTRTAVERANGRIHPSMRGAGRVAKRAMDLAVSIGAVIVLSPLFLVIYVAIRCTSPGPAFFRQERVGRDQQIFPMVKFRSMVANAEELRPQVAQMNDARGISFKIFNDPRVTAVGRFLRRTSLDELPQLFNVITGEMSVVGPRPIPVWVAEQLDTEKYVRRFCVQPGLTGLWQVEGRQQDFDLMATQDLRYVDNWSLWLDLWILFATVPAVLRGEGAH